MSVAAEPPSPLLYVPTRAAWRAWLLAHYREATEVWLVTYRKATGQPSVVYNDAVEEALCFGWIDSTRRGVDDERLAQRFTPRRVGSSYSQPNKERLDRLKAQGLVQPEVVAQTRDVCARDYDIPRDILAALEENPVAWAFFQGTSPAYQRIRAAYVDAGREREGAFEQRLRHLVDRCERRKLFGYGIETYY